MVNKTIKEAVTASAFNGMVPDNSIKVITPEEMTGVTSGDLSQIGMEDFPESLIKLSKEFSIDKYCID